MNPRHRQVWWWALCAGVLGCPTATPLGVDPAAEQLVDGPLALVETRLVARVAPDGLHVTVPALGEAPLWVQLNASVRELDGTVRGQATTSGLANQAHELVLAPGDHVDSPPAQAGRVLHLRANGGPWEVRSRRSLLALLLSPSSTVHAPSRVVLGTPTPWLVGTQDGATLLSSETQGAVQAGPMERVTGGAAGSFMVTRPEGGSLDVVARLEGAPRRTSVGVTGASQSRAYLVPVAMGVAPGEPLRVLVGGGFPDGAVLVLLDGQGVTLANAPIERATPLTGQGVLVAPWNAVAGPGLVQLLQDGEPLAQSPVSLQARRSGALGVTVQAQEEGTLVRWRVDATDGAGRFVNGRARLQVFHEGVQAADAHGPLKDGTWSLETRVAALLNGALQGLVSSVATVESEDGAAHSALATVLLGRAGLDVRAWAPECEAGRTCSLLVTVANAAGTPTAAAGLASMGNQAVPLQTDGLTGLAEVTFTPETPGQAAATVQCCTPDGRCGSTAIPVRVATAHAAPVAVRASFSVEEGPWDIHVDSTRFNAGVAHLLLPGADAANGGWVEGAASWLPGASPATLHVAVNRPGLHWLIVGALREDGAIQRVEQPLLVSPTSGQAPSVDVVDGVARISAPGAWLVAGWACGPSAVGTSWATGILGLPARQRADLGSREHLFALGPTLAAIRAPGPSLVLGPVARDDVAARRVLGDRARSDLDAVTAEARALVDEGSLTTTALGEWVERHQNAYLDAFGQPYVLRTESGRVTLKTRGPDETDGTPDDFTAEAPLEALVSFKPAEAASPLDPPGVEAALDLPLAQGSWMTGQDAVELQDPPSCGDAAWIHAVAVHPDGSVGAIERAIPHTTLALASRWTVGDTAPLHASHAARLDAPWGVSTESGPIHATRSGVLRAAASEAGLVTSSALATVFPVGGAQPVLRLMACNGNCDVTLRAGQTLEVWTHPQAACDAALDRISAFMPAEPAGTALAAAAAHDATLFGQAWPLALEEASASPHQRVPVTEAAQRYAAFSPVPPTGFVDGNTLPGDSLFDAEVAAALRALVMAREGVPLARQALSSSNVEAAALGALALARAGELSAAELQEVESRVGQGPVGTAALAELAVQQGRTVDAWMRLSGGELLRFPAPLQEQARMAAAWCTLARAWPSGNAPATVTNPRGQAADGRWLRADRNGVWRITASGPVTLAVGTQRAAPGEETLQVTYGAHHVHVGDTVEGLVGPNSGAPAWLRFQAAPGTHLVLGSFPVGEVVWWRGAAWVRPRASATPFRLRALDPAAVTLSPVESWTPHTGTWPTVDAPSRLTAD